VRQEDFPRDVIKGALMAGLQDQGRSEARFPGLLPPQDTEAPAIAGLQSGKSEFGTRCGQVVASHPTEAQEGGGDLGANQVSTVIVWPGATIAVAEESGLGGKTTGLEFFAEDIPGGFRRGGMRLHGDRTGLPRDLVIEKMGGNP